MEKGDSFAAAGIMDSGLLDEIVGQLQAVQNVAKPETEAINALWDLMYEYADMMDTAGYYYKRISLSTYVVTRRYYRALFENRLGRAHALTRNSSTRPPFTMAFCRTGPNKSNRKKAFSA